MIPGFVARPASGLQSASQGIYAAIWDDPKPSEPCSSCRPVRTDTSCILVTLWCTDVFNCCGREEKRTPYPCGVCVGADW